MNVLSRLLTRPRPSAASTLLLAGCALAAVGLARSSQTPPNSPPSQQPTTRAVPMMAPAATADSNGRMIAVTGTDVTGTSILYLVDTEKMRLVIYQANGGSESTQGIRFIGARRIDLDLELDGFNDKSEFPYKKLKDEFSKKGLIKADAAAAAPGGDK
jgi:hypothetical protein